MHLVPADRADHRIIDDHRACEAIAALGDPEAVASWARRFSLLADPGRLSLLVCIKAAGPISVTDLAVASGMNDTTVSQALRLLRAAGWSPRSGTAGSSGTRWPTRRSARCWRACSRCRWRS